MSGSAVFLQMVLGLSALAWLVAAALDLQTGLRLVPGSVLRRRFMCRALYCAAVAVSIDAAAILLVLA